MARPLAPANHFARVPHGTVAQCAGPPSAVLDTIDERIMSILGRKQGDFDAFADKSTAAEVDMQNEPEVKQEQLNAMFDEEIKRLESLMPSLADLDLPEGVNSSPM